MEALRSTKCRQLAPRCPTILDGFSLIVVEMGVGPWLRHRHRHPPAAPAFDGDDRWEIALPFPILDNDELAKLIHVNEDGDMPGVKAVTQSGLYRVQGGGLALKRALDSIRTQVSQAIADGARLIVLSDRNGDDTYVPSLLLTSAVHHHLIREKTRTRVGLIVATGDAREVHHMVLLVGSVPARSTRISRSSRSRT